MLPVLAKKPVDVSYSSALATQQKNDIPVPAVVIKDVPLEPPVIKTLPSGSRVAVWLSRATVIWPVAVKLPVEGSYSSAFAKGVFPVETPPAIKTSPLGSRVAV